MSKNEMLTRLEQLTNTNNVTSAKDRLQLIDINLRGLEAYKVGDVKKLYSLLMLASAIRL